MALIKGHTAALKTIENNLAKKKALSAKEQVSAAQEAFEKQQEAAVKPLGKAIVQAVKAEEEESGKGGKKP